MKEFLIVTAITFFVIYLLIKRFMLKEQSLLNYLRHFFFPNPINFYDRKDHGPEFVRDDNYHLNFRPEKKEKDKKEWKIWEKVKDFFGFFVFMWAMISESIKEIMAEPDPRDLEQGM